MIFPMALSYTMAVCFLKVISVSVEASSNMNQKNVFGAPLEPCSTDPMTGK